MKILDILFLPQLLVLLSLFSTNTTIYLAEMQIIYINFFFILTQIVLSFKYKLDEIRWIIIFLVAIGGGAHLFGVISRLGITPIATLIALFGIFTYFFAFLIYLYSFILKPIYLRIKKLSIR